MFTRDAGILQRAVPAGNVGVSLGYAPHPRPLSQRERGAESNMDEQDGQDFGVGQDGGGSGQSRLAVNRITEATEHYD